MQQKSPGILGDEDGRGRIAEGRKNKVIRSGPQDLANFPKGYFLGCDGCAGGIFERIFRERTFNDSTDMQRLFFTAAFALVFFIFGASGLRAEIKVLYVQPSGTDPAIEAVHGPNLAVYDTEATPQHRLFFFIGGTGSKATNSLAIDRVFARWGFPAVSIDYNNTVIAVSSAHSLDPTAFGRYRKT